jgi:hypothetical protein
MANRVPSHSPLTIRHSPALISVCGVAGTILRMTHDEWEIPRFSNDAVAILGHLKRAGGTMRMAPLYLRAGIAEEALFSALTELAVRRWVHVKWRKPRAAMPPGLPERARKVERITLSRFGRWRYAVTWPRPP